MAAPIPTTEPTAITAGDTLKWKRTLPDYPASVWTLTYELRGPASITITASADGDLHSVSVAKATTAGWHPGLYSWAGYVTDGSERYQVIRGSIEVEPDIASVAAGHDPRSHARRALEAIEAVLEKRASIDQRAYTINGRSLERTPIEDLLRMRSTYKAEVAREENAERLRQGLKSSGVVRVRF